MSSSKLILAQRVEAIKPSPTLAVSAKADELKSRGKPIINLSVGEPDFDTPHHVKEAAIKAIRDGLTKYTAVDGTKSLKTAIINKLERENQLNYAQNQIIVSCGAKHSLYNLFSALLNPGDEVIIPAPYWVSYPDMALLNEATPVFVNTDFENSFKLTPETLKKAITSKTRLFIINSPSNPTGMTYSKQELQALGQVLLEHPDIIIASDDIYEHILWNHTPFQNILNACPDLYDRTVIINGVSKSYAMTGWRIGFAAGPAKLIAAMKKAQSQSTSNPSSISQYAAEAAFSGDQSCIVTMNEAYHERHQFLHHELNDIPGFSCLPSDGTFYSFPSIKKLLMIEGGMDDLSFAEYLLNEANVAVVPGSAFGASGHLRISFATSMDHLRLAVQQIKNAVERLIKGK